MPVKNSVLYFTRKSLSNHDDFKKLEQKIKYYHLVLYVVKNSSTDKFDILALAKLYRQILFSIEPLYKYILYKKYDLNTIRKKLKLKPLLKIEGILSSYNIKENTKIKKENDSLVIKYISDDFHPTFDTLLSNAHDSLKSLLESNKVFLKHIDNKYKINEIETTFYDQRDLTDDFEIEYPDLYNFFENLKS